VLFHRRGWGGGGRGVQGKYALPIRGKLHTQKRTKRKGEGKRGRVSLYGTITSREERGKEDYLIVAINSLARNLGSPRKGGGKGR